MSAHISEVANVVVVGRWVVLFEMFEASYVLLWGFFRGGEGRELDWDRGGG
jgi:hypothetical protein